MTSPLPLQRMELICASQDTVYFCHIITSRHFNHKLYGCGSLHLLSNILILISVIWDLMSCRLVNHCHHFRGSYCLHLQAASPHGITFQKIVIWYDLFLITCLKGIQHFVKNGMHYKLWNHFIRKLCILFTAFTHRKRWISLPVNR